MRLLLMVFAIALLAACQTAGKTIPTVAQNAPARQCTTWDTSMTLVAGNPRYIGAKVGEIKDTHKEEFLAAFNATGTPTEFAPDNVFLIVPPAGRVAVLVFVKNGCMEAADEFPRPLIDLWARGKTPEM